jgi:L-ascorbate metabolism protein UlaG (beta-lactamase superfamily)
LGRGTGRLRVIDGVNPPPRSARRPDLSRWHNQELAAVWIGHATVLLRVAGMTILTDPVMSNRVGLGMGFVTAGPTRVTRPALSIRQLPPIDLILISHAHFDHLDRPTLARLPKNVPVVTAPQTRDLLDDLRFDSVTEIGWGESLQVSQVKLTAQKVQHWGARTFYDQHRGFNAYLIEGANRRVLYGGDTAYQEDFREIGKVDLAILGISAYDPYVQAHATPEQAWAMADHVRADYILPMHHSTFRLSYEPMDEPIERLLAAAGRDEQRVIAREVGDSWSLT